MQTPMPTPAPQSARIDLRFRNRRTPITVTYDASVDAGYVSLRRGRVQRTEELNPTTLLDLDAKGQVVGIEVLGSSALATFDGVGAWLTPSDASRLPAIRSALGGVM